MAMRPLAVAPAVLLGLPLILVAQPTGPRDLLTDFLTFPLQNVRAEDEAPEELFTIIFVADSEPRMRGNTDEELRHYIKNLVSYKSSRVEYFAFEGGSRHRIDPQLVILGGDISADRETSIENDAALWQPLSDHGIAFLAGFGNHDWSSTYSISGDSWNAKALEFCRDTYRNATRVAAPYFGYREFGPTDNRGPVTTVAHFRGVQIVNFNSFLYQPSYHYDFESQDGQDCLNNNALTGWDGCQVFSSAEPQIQRLERALDRDAGVATLFVQHYPMDTRDEWWDDHGASRTSVVQKKRRLMTLVGRYDSSVLLSGHNHRFDMRSFFAGSGIHTEFVAPYFGGRNGVDFNEGGGFLALLVSRNRGIVEVKHVRSPLYNQAPPHNPSMTTSVPSASTSSGDLSGRDDLSILGSVTDFQAIQACVFSSCFPEAVICSGDNTCYGLFNPLVVSGDGLERPEIAQLLWAATGFLGTNTAVRAVAICVDSACGSAIISASERSAARTTTLEVTTAPATTTTWNPWVAGPASGCRGHGGVSIAVTAAFVAMASARLPCF